LGTTQNETDLSLRFYFLIQSLRYSYWFNSNSGLLMEVGAPLCGAPATGTIFEFIE
jgi:hypothetical protein